LPRAWPWALDKDYFLKKIWSKNWVKKIFAEGLAHGSRQRLFFKKKIGRKTGSKKNFAEGLTAGPRQSLTGVATVTQRA
jgi:hypothetical protein